MQTLESRGISITSITRTNGHDCLIMSSYVRICKCAKTHKKYFVDICFFAKYASSNYELQVILIMCWLEAGSVLIAYLLPQAAFEYSVENLCWIPHGSLIPLLHKIFMPINLIKLFIACICYVFIVIKILSSKVSVSMQFRIYTDFYKNVAFYWVTHFLVQRDDTVLATGNVEYGNECSGMR